MAAETYRGSIYIDAAPAEVFEYFRKPESLAMWMGDRAILDPRPGGKFVVFFENRAVEGKYIEIQPPTRVVVSWGRAGSREFPPSSSTLEVTLRTEGAGTRVEVVHSGLPVSEFERHALGWAHYLARLANVASGLSVEPHTVPEKLTRGVE